MPIVYTPDKLEYRFEPAPSGYFHFKVRAAHDANLALVPTPNEAEPIYEIFIGGWNNTKSVIRRNRKEPDVIEVSTPDILSSNEFRGFWIRWYDNLITVGSEGQADAFMSYKAPTFFQVNFVGICTGRGANGTWLLDKAEPSAPQMMGVIPSPQNRSSPGCWVSACNGRVPRNAVQGGFDDNDKLYIARARHADGLIPGKLHPSHGVCYIGHNGYEYGYTCYEVFCYPCGCWIFYNGKIPRKAIPGGKTARGETLFIARRIHNNTMTIGKIQRSRRGCLIPYDGKEIYYETNFEIYVRK